MDFWLVSISEFESIQNIENKILKMEFSISNSEKYGLEVEYGSLKWFQNIWIRAKRKIQFLGIRNSKNSFSLSLIKNLKWKLLLTFPLFFFLGFRKFKKIKKKCLISGNFEIWKMISGVLSWPET
ncbi:unnamed protein product [Rhizophagus irregularis]|nr:unnamed protein product [Rhizophagus irregularis]